MTYRNDAEVFRGYGTFVNKTSKEKIKSNGFLKYFERNYTDATNITRYKIIELSKRTKGE